MATAARVTARCWWTISAGTNRSCRRTASTGWNTIPCACLNSKEEGDQKIVADAPLYSDYLNDASRAFFDAVKSELDTLGIRYALNPRLVRGLDYYCHTCFEFTAQELGAQKTVMAGVAETMASSRECSAGGGPAPGVGGASGCVERDGCMTLAEGNEVLVSHCGYSH